MTASPTSPARAALATFGLFVVWSNSFVAASYLLGSEAAPGSFDWLGLSVARFVVILPLCAAYCFGWHARASWEVVRAYPVRLLAAGLLAVPGYNFALFFGQQHGVPPPVASLTTALLPLFIGALAAMFLGERPTARRGLAFLVAATGLVVIAMSRGEVGEIRYSTAVGVTALAPLSWAGFSVLSKPLTQKVPPLLWTFLAITVGTVPLALVAPFRGGPEMATLDLPGWAALMFLSILCTAVGFAVWTWLLRQIPASVLGFATFLNPPLTTTSKFVLAALFPATFVFAVQPLEWFGGALALAGLTLAVTERRPRPSPAAIRTR